MPFLNLPNSKIPGKKPTGLVKIDRSTPLSKYLYNSYAFLPDAKLEIDYAGKRNGIVTDPSKVLWTPQGIDFTGGTSVTSRFDLGEVTSDHPLSLVNSTTLVMRVRIDVSQGFDRLIDKSDGGNALNGWAILQATAGNLWLIKDGQYVELASVSYVVGEWFDLFIRSDGNGVTIGTRDASDAWVGSVPTTTTNAALGNWNHSTTDRMTDGQVEYLHIFDSELSDEHINSVWDDPYQLYKPSVEDVYYVPAGAGSNPIATNDSYNVTDGATLVVNVADGILDNDTYNCT